MRVLFICSDYYPYVGACSSLLKKMIQEGNFVSIVGQIDILSIKRNLNDKEYEIIDNVGVYRTTCWRYFGKKQIQDAFRKNIFKATGGITKKLLSKMVVKIDKRCIFEPAITVSFYKKIHEICHNNKYDYIIPIVGNLSIAQAALKYIEKKSLRMIVYQVDPISTNYLVEKEKKERVAMFEKNLFSAATAIITTPILLREYLNLNYAFPFFNMEFPNIGQNCQISNCAGRDNEIINCIFAGSIYHNIRNPMHTLLLFDYLKDFGINLDLIGVKATDLPMDCPNGRIRCIGQKSIEETADILREADFLVNIGNIMKNQVPSKLFEYISTGIPIINIAKNRDCPTLSYLKKYEYSITVFEDNPIEYNAKIVLDFIRANRGKRMSQDSIRALFRDCTAVYCAKRFGDIMALKKQ